MKTSNITLADILPKPTAHVELRSVKRIKFNDDAQRAIVEQAASDVRTKYTKGVAAKSAETRFSGESWHDACFDTVSTVFELDDCVADDTELSIAYAIFDKAGLLSTDLKPTSLRSQVEMQITAVEYARRCKSLFMKQEALAL